MQVTGTGYEVEDAGYRESPGYRLQDTANQCFGFLGEISDEAPTL